MKTVDFGNKKFYVVPIHPEIIRQLELTAKEKWKIENRGKRIKAKERSARK